MAKKTEIVDLEDLGASTNVATPTIDVSDVNSPSLAEKFYAERLVAGLHDMPAESELSAGTKQAIGEITKSNVLPSNEAGRDLVNQLLGQAQAAKAISQFSRTIGISKLAFVKETKTYKSLKGMNSAGTELRGTWEEFCGLLNLSVDKADADIANLRSFGQEALESMTLMGVGYRDLAQYRKLPDDERVALIEAAKTGDKDQLLELAESLIEKHITEKAQLTEKANELEQDKADAGKRINNMNAEIQRQALKLERLGEKKSRITTFEERTEDVRDECMHLQAGVEVNLNSIQKLFEELNHEDSSSPEYRLRLEQVWVVASICASRSLGVLERLRAISMIEDLPDNIQGQHILTPAEAQRWALDAPMIESKHSAEKLSREVKRENDKPKGRGRPSGSKNKAE